MSPIQIVQLTKRSGTDGATTLPVSAGPPSSVANSSNLTGIQGSLGDNIESVGCNEWSCWSKSERAGVSCAVLIAVAGGMSLFWWMCRIRSRYVKEDELLRNRAKRTGNKDRPQESQNLSKRGDEKQPQSRRQRIITIEKDEMNDGGDGEREKKVRDLRRHSSKHAKERQGIHESVLQDAESNIAEVNTARRDDHVRAPDAPSLRNTTGIRQVKKDSVQDSGVSKSSQSATDILPNRSKGLDNKLLTK
jgi:hypothetical protein